MSWILSRRSYQGLIENAEVIARGGRTIKVLRLPGGELVKLFWLRKRLSSAWLYPYSIRFARNARRLIAAGVPCLIVKRTHFVPGMGLHVAIYDELPGQTLMELPLDENLARLAEFIALLHHKGIYFRSLHMGNVVRCEDGSFGLIDVADLRFKHRPLTVGERSRNLVHLLRRPDNRQRYGWSGFVSLLDAYLEACDARGEGGRELSDRIDEFKLSARAQFP